jgi:hypothetical protein
MPRYLIGGYEEYPVLDLVPTEQRSGTVLPLDLYNRWRHARAELDAVQRDVITHLRDTGGREAIPEELRDRRDHDHAESLSTAWDGR